MSIGRARIDGGGNYMRPQGPGDSIMEMTQPVAITTAGSGTITAQALIGTLIERTGPAGAFNETLETADNLIAAVPNLSPGDSFEVTYRNTVAFAATLVAAEGAELFGAFTGVAASSVRRFLVTVFSNLRRQSFLASSTNASPTITGLTQAQAQLLQPGMGISAASGITAGTTILSVNSVTGTVTLSANATVTQQIAMTFFPRYNIRGLWSATL
jgi:hypothetical protein